MCTVPVVFVRKPQSTKVLQCGTALEDEKKEIPISVNPRMDFYVMVECHTIGHHTRIAKTYLDTDFIGLFMRLLKDKVDHLSDLI